MRRSWIAAAGGLVLLAIVLALGLARDVYPSGYTNQVPNFGPAVTLRPGQELCQPEESVPADPGTVTLYTGAPEGPAGPAEVRVEDRAGRVLLRSRPSSGPLAAATQLELPDPPRALAGVTVCVRLRGAKPVVLGGATNLPTPAVPELGPEPTLDGKPQPGRIRLEYAAPPPDSALGLLSTAVARAGLAKGDLVGTALVWIALLGCVLAGIGAVVVAVREARA